MNVMRPSSTTSEVAKQIFLEQPEHSVALENIEILTTESRWFERGVKEAIYVRALNPSLNRDGGGTICLQSSIANWEKLEEEMKKKHT